MLQKLMAGGQFVLTHHGAVIFAIVATVVITVLFLRNRRCPLCNGRKTVREKKTDFPLIVNQRLATDRHIVRCATTGCEHVYSENRSTRRPTKIELLGLG